MRTQTQSNAIDARAAAAPLAGPELAPGAFRAEQLQAAACGAKPMTWCIRAAADVDDAGAEAAAPPFAPFVLKPVFGGSLDKAMSSAVVDACKPLFGLARTNVRLVRAPLESRQVGETREVRRVRGGKAERRKEQDHALTPAPDGRPRLFLRMDLVEDAPGSGRPARMVTDATADMLASRAMLAEYLCIGVFRALFHVSDFNPRNVLMDAAGRLYSIDESFHVASRKAPAAPIPPVLGPRSGALLAAIDAAPELLEGALAAVVDNAAALAAVEGVVREVAPCWDAAALGRLVAERAAEMRTRVNDELAARRQPTAAEGRPSKKARHAQ